MKSSIQRLISTSAAFLVYFSVSTGFAASAETDYWQEDIKQSKIKQNEIISIDSGALQTADSGSGVASDSLELLSIGENAIKINEAPTDSTLFNRDSSTWPYYLLSHSSDKDSKADILMSIAKFCGIIFIIGLTILLLRFFKLRKLRSELLH